MACSGSLDQDAQRSIHTLRPLQPSGDEPGTLRKLRAVEHSAHPAFHHCLVRCYRDVRVGRSRRSVLATTRLEACGAIDFGAPPARHDLCRVRELVAKAGTHEHGRRRAREPPAARPGTSAPRASRRTRAPRSGPRRSPSRRGPRRSTSSPRGACRSAGVGAACSAATSCRTSPRR